MKYVLLAFSVMLSIQVVATENVTVSPDGKCQLTVEERDGEIWLRLKGLPDGTPSAVAFRKDQLPLADGLKFKTGSDDEPSKVTYKDGVLKVRTVVYLVGRINLDLEIAPDLTKPGKARLVIGPTWPIRLLPTMPDDDIYDCQF